MLRILIVDNAPDVLDTLQGLLSDKGFLVQTATNEGEALRAITVGAFDFALIDVRLHEEDETDESGLSLAMAFQRFKPHIRVILLTSYVRTHQIVRALRYLGVVDFIEKRATMGEEILHALAHAKKEWRPNDLTRLTIALTEHQPLSIRSHGHYVCSLRTWKNLQIDIERYARKSDLLPDAAAQFHFQAQEIGWELWRAIFEDHPETGRAFLMAQSHDHLLALHFESPRDFLRLPLELIRSKEPDEYLALQYPIARFIFGAVPKRPPLSPRWLATMDKLRVLIIATNTYPPIDGVDAEAIELRDIISRHVRLPTEVTLLATHQATYDRVKQELQKDCYDIIHYAGHSHHDIDSPGKSALYFWEREAKHGERVELTVDEMKLLLEHSRARLIYLSSCSGAASSDQSELLDDDFLGVADGLIHAGVPSVLGFRWRVSDAGARKMARVFYEFLLDTGSPEIALWRARRELATADKNDLTWLSPILIHQE